MFIFKKLGKLLRGNPSLMQILVATVAGGAMGFAVGPAEAPAFYVAMFVIVLVLNCNLFLFALALALGTTASLVLTPVSFALGEWMAVGPLRPLMESVVNAPVLAWMGFEYFVMSGGLLFGVALGLTMGFLIYGALRSYLKKMAALEEQSERFAKVVTHPLFKFVTLILLGGFKGKQSFAEQLNSRKKVLPVRPLGIVAVVLAGVTLYLATLMFDSAFFTTRAREALTELNGATVEIDSLDLRLGRGGLEVRGLSAADPEDLGRDRIAVERLTADVSWGDILARRVRVEELAIVNVVAGGQRRVPGQPFEAIIPEAEEKGGLFTVDMTPEEAVERVERLYGAYQKVREVVESIQSRLPEREESEAPVDPEQTESWRDRLKREIEAIGYRAVKADFLLTRRSQIIVDRVQIDGVRIVGSGLGVVDILLEGASNAPMVLGMVPELSVQTREGEIRLFIRGGSLAGEATGDTLTVAANELPLALLHPVLPSQLKGNIQGGQFTILADGSIVDQVLAVPAELVLNNVQVRIPRLGDTTLGEIRVPARIRGPLGAPEFSLDTAALGRQIETAAREGAQKALESEAAKRLEEKAGEVLRDTGVQERLRGLLGR